MKQTAPPPVRGVVPVLLYHSVPETNDPNDPLSVSSKLFAAHLDTIVASERTPITVGELAAGLRNERPIPDRAVAITFDDAFENTVDAVELLCAQGLRANVYVTTGQMDRASMLRRDQLEWLSRRPEMVELGAHSVTHPRLDELSSDEITQEVFESKRRMEELVGRTIDAFAYPYGNYDQRVRSAAIAAGYSSAAAVKNALSHPGDDPWAIARWTVRSTTGPQQIAQLLDGRDAPRAWKGERIRTRGYRLVRKLKRRIVGSRKRRRHI